MVVGSFLIPVTNKLIQDKHIVHLPAPTRLLTGNDSVATWLPVFFAAAFGLSIWTIKSRYKDEADRLSLELVAHTIIWFIAVTYWGGVCMAAFLPWAIAINR